MALPLAIRRSLTELARSTCSKSRWNVQKLKVQEVVGYAAEDQKQIRLELVTKPLISFTVMID